MSNFKDLVEIRPNDNWVILKLIQNQLYFHTN